MDLAAFGTRRGIGNADADCGAGLAQFFFPATQGHVARTDPTRAYGCEGEPIGMIPIDGRVSG